MDGFDFHFGEADYANPVLLIIAAEYLVGRITLDTAIARVCEHGGFDRDWACGWLAKGMSADRLRQILGADVEVDSRAVEARRLAVFGA